MIVFRRYKYDQDVEFVFRGSKKKVPCFPKTSKGKYGIQEVDFPYGHYIYQARGLTNCRKNTDVFWFQDP